MKKVGDLKYEETIHHDLQLGGMKSCLDFLGIDMSLPWLAGATAHAFLLSVDKVMCPSCPSCVWAGNTERLVKLARNIGVALEYVHGPGEAADRKEAWDFVKNAIDNGRPCYGPRAVCWGYDDVGYYLNDAKEPKPWQEGITFWTEVYSVQKTEPADEITTVRDTLALVIWWSQAGGSELAYDNWICAIAEQRVNCQHGGQCAARVWSELRRLAAQFLDEAKQRVGIAETDQFFDDARGHYREVCENLEPVAHRFRVETISEHQQQLADEAVRNEVVGQLKAAKAAESAALKALERIVTIL